MTPDNPMPQPAEQDLVSRALAAGWDASPTSLYDEEGVEGWRWTSPTGEEFTCMGDWSAPIIDSDELKEAVLASLAN